MSFLSSSSSPAIIRLLSPRVISSLRPLSLQRQLPTPLPPLHATFGPTFAQRPVPLPQQRWFSSTSRFLQESNNHDVQPISKPVAAPTPTQKPKPLLSRLIPIGEDPSKSASSFRAIVSLARPEKRPLTLAVGLLLVSSSVSMSIPFTVGKLIDFFSSSNPVRFVH